MSKTKLFTFLLIFLSFSAIFSFYNFDSASAQGIVWTYNADTNTATASGSGTTNFAALVAADTAGGWGVFTADASGTQIRSAATQIVIGDGTNACAFVDSGKEVLFDYTGSRGPTYLIDVAANSSLVLGTLNDAATYDTCNGVDFILMSRYGLSNLANRVSSTSAYYYSCSFSAIPQPGWSGGIIRIQGSANADTTANVRVWNCVFDNQATLYACNEYAEFYNVIVSKTSGTSGLNSLRNSTINRITIYRCDNAITNTGAGVTSTYRNILSRNATSAFLRQESNSDCYLVNPDVDSRTFTFTGTGKVYWQYEFDLNVLNGEITDFVQNANVTLYKDGSKIYSALTNSSGMIPTQTLTYGYYQQATGDTIQNATSPYYLVITHPDWQTYISRFYITQPFRLTVSMQEPTYTGYTEAEKSDYTTIILFVISLILCIIGLALTVPLLPLISLTISVINIIFLSEPSIFNILLIILNVIFTIISLVRVKTKNN